MFRAIAALPILFCSCTLFAIGAGVALEREYREGIGVQDFLATIQDTWSATQEQMDELGIEYSKEFKLDFVNGSQLTVTDGWVEITPHPKDHRYTRIRAKFAGTGSKDKSRTRAFELLDGVDSRLGGAGPPQD